jgi:quinol monooxygenase YgiN
MIFITAKFQILPEHADAWPEISAEFTEATRSEPGCLWFDWSRSLADPAEYVLVEAFRDGEAGGAHVQSDHFKKAQRTLPPFLARTRRSSTRPCRRTTGRCSARWRSPKTAEHDYLVPGGNAKGAYIMVGSTHRGPVLINPVAKSLVAMNRVLPARAYDSMLRRQYGLPR